jgi:alkylation response protein AidB-like acyl-CoA dehydrogenase
MKCLFAEEYELLRNTLRRFRAQLDKEFSGDGNPLQATVPLQDVLGAVQLPGLLAEDSGRSGFDGVCWGLVFEELGPSAVGPQLLAQFGLGAVCLHQLSRRSDIANQYLRATLTAELAPALAVQEPHLAAWMGSFSTTSRPTGTGFELTGEKTSVMGASDCDLLLVIASEDGQPNLFAVDLGAPGLEIRNSDSLDPALALSSVRLNGTPAIPLAAGEDSTWRDLSRALDLARLALATMCLGSAQDVLTTTVSYASIREAFGLPISRYQAVSHRCADMHVMVDEMRALAYRACLDAEAEDGLEFAHSACLAKLVCSEGYARVAADGLRVESGIGVTWENPLSTHYRRAYWARGLLGGPAVERKRAVQLAIDSVHAE